MARRTSYDRVYQFHISLPNLAPPIWRRIQVPANYSFWDLHVAIQDAMGWLDYHLHVFRILNPNSDSVEEIGIPDDMGELHFLPGWDLRIADYFSLENPRAEYEYDFGDCWEHEVVLEAVLPREAGKYPRCIAGERACPPEDCGGLYGYQDLLEALFDPTHEEHESLKIWAGESFHPEKFDPTEVRFDNPAKRWRNAFLKP